MSDSLFRKGVRGAAAILALSSVALATPGCTKGDHDVINDRLAASAATEGEEMLEVAVVGMGPAIRAALGVSEAGGDVEDLDVENDEGEVFELFGTLDVSGSGTTRTVNGTLEVLRGDEHPIAVELVDVVVDFGAADVLTNEATFVSGTITLATEAHADLGGRRGGHSHGEPAGGHSHGAAPAAEEEEEEATFEVSLELVLPTGTGAFGVLRYLGGAVPYGAEEPLEPVPAAVP